MRVQAPFGRRACRVAAAESVGAYRVITAEDPDGPEPWPGQFYMLAAVERWGAGTGERPYLPRAFSFLSATEGRLQFMLEDVGPGTERLAELEPGDELWLLGPLGVGFPLPEAGRRAVLCGGGVGVPPLAALRARLQGEVPTILGFRDAAHAEAAELLPGATITTDDGSVGRQGFVTEALAELLEDGDVVYACGPPGMLESVRALCAERGIEARLALESGMACGYGACFGCVVPLAGGGYLRLCVDGPVVEAARLAEVAHP